MDHHNIGSSTCPPGISPSLWHIHPHNHLPREITTLTHTLLFLQRRWTVNRSIIWKDWQRCRWSLQDIWFLWDLLLRSLRDYMERSLGNSCESWVIEKDSWLFESKWEVQGQGDSKDQVHRLPTSLCKYFLVLIKWSKNKNIQKFSGETR